MGGSNWRGESASSSTGTSSYTDRDPLDKFSDNRGATASSSPGFLAWQESLKQSEKKHQEFVQEWYAKRGLVAPQAKAPAPSQESPEI